MRKYRLLFFLIFAAGVNLSAQTFKPASNPAKILEDLRKASQAVVSVEADFKEEKYMAILKHPEQSSGVFYYKKNDRMRWEQQKPTRYTILINGDKLRVGEAGKEKNIASAGRMASQIKELMIGLVNGDFQQNKAFSQTCNENAEQYQIVLTPVSNRLKRVYEKIHLVFPKSSLRLKELTFFEKGGDKSVMVFSNEKVNQQIQETIFLNL
jgi:outer membrane lipoprotein-sorting protein